MLEVQKFIDGVNASISDFQNNEISDIEGAIESFEVDPANTPFQEGYLEGLIGINKQGLLPTITTLTSGNLRRELSLMFEED